jgi:hypothetical protein
MIKGLQFVALVLSALALVPAGAHLFSMANKIGLSQRDYFVVQSIYSGWALFGSVLIGNLIALAALAYVQRRRKAPFVLVLVGLGAQIATLTIFFAVVFPANQATVNWTVAPPAWEPLRTQWEWGHAVDAVIAFAGFCALAASVVLTRPQKS